ncbi:MAG: hypothetical protein JWR83_690 [Aeromicrobium sp.]|nr:hypothetical protein [Aeromicrobium sp.]
MLRQQLKYFILERRKVVAPSWGFPRQDAQVDRHGPILPFTCPKRIRQWDHDGLVPIAFADGLSCRSRVLSRAN